MNRNEEICSVDVFHAKKKHEKEDYIEKIGKDGIDDLFYKHTEQFKQELKKYSELVETQINTIASIVKGKDKILYFDELLSRHKWNNRKISFPIEENKQSRIYQYMIFNCELGENIGYEKSKTRPVIILSSKPLKKKSVLIAPITTTKVRNGIPIKGHTKYEKVTGYIDLNHIRSVDKNRLSERMCDRLYLDHEYVDLGIEKEPIKPLIQKRIEDLIK